MKASIIEVKSMSLSFRRASREDAKAITVLVNSGYRGEISKQGWTTEADLLEGTRTDTNEVLELVAASNSIIYLCERSAQLVGSLHLKRLGAQAHLGMLVIKPDLQGAGLGKQFLFAAEQFASQEWGVSKITMKVITLRTELIAFYERRGYTRTGNVEPFCFEGSGSAPKVEGLLFEYLEKSLPTN